MKHLIKGRKLNRTTAHRKAMFSNMANSLLKYSRIKTTLAKAKELRRYIEPIITRAKENTLHNKRIVLKFGAEFMAGLFVSDSCDILWKEIPLRLSLL